MTKSRRQHTFEAFAVQRGRQAPARWSIAPHSYLAARQAAGNARVWHDTYRRLGYKIVKVRVTVEVISLSREQDTHDWPQYCLNPWCKQRTETG